MNAVALAILCLGLVAGTPVAHAQIANTLGSRVTSDPDARMLLEADELIYDFDKNRVLASGFVQIYYNGYVVQADEVIYNQNTNRVHARGNVKVTAPDGYVTRAKVIELTDDFAEGFIEQLVVETPEEARFAAQSAERQGNKITIFNRGIYTACKACEKDPTKPLVWQIKAARIIHNEEERIVYYEDASFEFLGVSILKVPYFLHPDPTVERQSGFLPPSIIFDSQLGAGLEVPYYFALDPSYDLTVAATGFTKQGVLGQAEWRQRTETGQYSVHVAGIYQASPDEFRRTGGAINNSDLKEWRSAIRTNGLFAINEFWQWGWEGGAVSDPLFLRTYNISDDTEIRSQVFLEGQSANNWFAARVLHYQSLNDIDRNDRLPIVHPSVDYNFILPDPVAGGELSLDVFFMSLSRDEPDFVSFLDTPGPGQACPLNLVPTTPTVVARFLNPALFNPANCVLLGVPGTSTRLIADLNWKKTIVGPVGTLITPFASLRGDLYALDIDDPYSPIGGGAPIVGQYIPTGNSSYGRGMATAGVEARWPILVTDSWGYQVFEPVAQVIVRPDARHVVDTPVEDAISFVFDDTNLFEIDKFSGYDLVEGGSRANVGLRYMLHTNSGFTVRAIFGQSYHLGGTNPFPLGSGLETTQSDFVAALYLAPTKDIDLVARFRLDERDFGVNQMDIGAQGELGPIEASAVFTRVSAQPVAGLNTHRSEVFGSMTVKLSERWKVFGAARYELEGTLPAFDQWVSFSAGVGYEDECLAVSLQYTQERDARGQLGHDHKVTLQFKLRTLAEGKVSSSIDDL